MCSLPEGQEQVWVAQNGDVEKKTCQKKWMVEELPEGKSQQKKKVQTEPEAGPSRGKLEGGGLEMAEALCPIKKKIEGWVALLLHKLDRQNNLLEGLMRLKEEDTWLNHEDKEAEAKAANLEEERAGAPTWLEMEDKDEGGLEKSEEGSNDQEWDAEEEDVLETMVYIK